MLDNVLLIVGILALAAAACAVLFYVGAGWVLTRMAERVADELARQIDAAFARRADAGASVASQRIRALAAEQGIGVPGAKALLLARIERLARLMDAAVQVPVLGRVGLDALIGLVPVAGDVVSATASLTIIVNAIQYGLPRQIVAKMVANVAVDLAFGAIPVIGDLMDIAFKANMRNVELVKHHLQTRDRL